MPATAAPPASENLICNIGVRFSQADWDGLLAYASARSLTPAQALRRILRLALRREARQRQEPEPARAD